MSINDTAGDATAAVGAGCTEDYVEIEGTGTIIAININCLHV